MVDEEQKKVEAAGEKIIFPAVEALKKQIVDTRFEATTDLYTYSTWSGRKVYRGIHEVAGQAHYKLESGIVSNDAGFSFMSRVIHLYLLVRPYIVNIKEKDKDGKATKNAKFLKLKEIDKLIGVKLKGKKFGEWIERFMLLDEYLYSTGLIKLSLDKELTQQGFGRR